MVRHDRSSGSARVVPRHRALRPLSFGVAALGAVAALAACGSSSSSASSPASSSGSTPAAAAPVTTAAGTTGAGGSAIAVDEKDFSIAFDKTALTAGAHTLTVHNSGKVTHALLIDGPGVKDQSSGAIAPGATATMQVTFQTGDYEIYCPVANHKMIGMDEHVTVA